MATWKKLVVSGSAISQLTNDSGYISASQVPAGANGFSSASYNGTVLIADNATGSLAFASSSGQGLTISANSGTDTLTWGLASIPTSSLEKSGSTIGSTFVGLGSTITTLAGLTSVTATNFTGTASFATSASTADLLDGLHATSFVLNSQTSSMTVASASQALTASYATGYVLTSATASMNVTSASRAVSASNADLLDGLDSTAFVLNSQTSSMTVLSASYATSVNNLTNAIANNVDNRLLTAQGTGIINGEANLTFDGTTLNITGNQIISGDLTVNGTTTTLNTNNLIVEDKFILLSSGSTSSTDGGIIIQSAAGGLGNAFIYDSAQARWAFTGSLDSTAVAAAPDAFVAAVLDLNVAESTDKAIYQKNGNIRIDTNQDIYIYS